MCSTLFLCSWHRVVATSSPGMTPQQSSHGKPQSLERSMLKECLSCILRTGGGKPAGGRREGGDTSLIKQDGQREEKHADTPQQCDDILKCLHQKGFFSAIRESVFSTASFTLAEGYFSLVNQMKAITRRFSLWASIVFITTCLVSR